MKLQETRRNQVLLLFTALVFALTMYPTQAQAQIVGSLEADIPFQFHVGSVKLPPGTYTIHMLDDSGLTVMEISSADGSSSALFQVREEKVKPVPGKSELVFNKYGHRYFLEELVEESSPGASKVIKTGYETRIAAAAAEGQEHVPAHPRQQQGN